MISQKDLYIIGEINSGHFGDLTKAEEAIDVISKTGANAIKFQSWAPESLFTKAYLKNNSLEERMYRKFSLKSDDLAHLRNHAKKVGIDFGSTVYSEPEVDDLIAIGADFIKIASMDLVNPELLRAACRSSLPVIISTGMASQDEVRRAVYQCLESNPNVNLTVLHCTSVYPTKLQNTNLSTITWLQGEFPQVKVGYSDHSTGAFSAASALSLGSMTFEKHFTLDKKKPGFDNEMAMSVEEFGEFVRTLQDLKLSLSSNIKALTTDEIDMKKIMRRSAFFRSKHSKGDIVDMGDFEFKRPGSGLSYYEVLELTPFKINADVEEGAQLDLSVAKGEELEN